ncbi:metal ABC transporter permease [Rhodovulum sp. DZ06]|uniref:metal ABC transporter permease n=1 Tax=Rhodovulum sp. DZ06 TaxID=3425126 RepID=UPI003D345965
MSLDELLLPLQFAFMQNALLIGAIVAVPTAMLSCFLVLKGWSLMGDAVSHAILPGVVVAHVLGLPLLVGAFAAGMGCALLTGFLSANSRVKQDTVMGVVFSGMFGVGIVMFAAVETDVHLDHILFGDMLGITPEALRTAAVISAVTGAVLLAKWKDFLLHAFDPAQAQACGLNGAWLHYGMLTLLSLTIVAVLSSVGLILAVALLIAPGAIGFLTARRFAGMMMVASGATLAAMLGGAYLSFWLDSAPAPTVVLLLTGMFLAAFAARMRANRRASAKTGAAAADPAAA